ncbi:MAG: flagellar filament capping protein FliD [Gallionella sp.]|jgi:flagellar hook-associated protein 2|nr:flagellar filament capping protein FliD [Gallionella sp.]
MSTTVAASSSAPGTIDVQSLVAQLMAVANQPVTAINSKIATEQTQLSDFGTLSGLVSSLQTTMTQLSIDASTNSATSSNTAAVTPTANSTAVAGSYAVNISSLAQAQSLVSAGQASSSTAISNGTATTVTFAFGTTAGTTFTANGSAAKSITIDSTNNTLSGIAAAINAANMGVTATIINDGSTTAPYHIALTSNSTGASNSLQITTAGGDGTINTLLAYNPAGTMNMTQTVAAQNANFTLNSIPISSASNTVANAIQGVSLTLGSVTTSPVTLKVGPNTQGVTSDITSFTSAYNALWNQLKTLSAYGSSPTSGGATTAGDLPGNSTIRTMMSQMQSVLDTATTPASGGSLSYLAQIGVAMKTDGTLSVDSAMLNTALTNKFSDVGNLLTSATGVINNMNSWANAVLAPGNGLIPSATSAINSTITDQKNKISQMNAQNTILQAQYLQQYTNLNMLLTSMNSTSTYLAQQFASAKN